MDDHFRFFPKKTMVGFLAKSYEHFLSPTPWRFKLLKKTPPNCWGTDPVVEVFLLVHPPPPPKTPIWIGIQNPYSAGNSFLVETILKKTTRFQRFFCSPGTLRKLDPFFDFRAYFGQRVFVKNRQRKRENNHGRLILVASYPSTAQSSDFVNAVPTGPFRPAKEKTPENLEETQTPLFRKNGVFFPPN